MSAAVILIPVATVSEANVRTHWAVRAKRARQQREAARLHILARAHLHLDNKIQWPVGVLLVRISPRPLDDDNLRGALKACRDGIADALGVNDNDPRVTWSYGQRRGRPRQQAVEVTVGWPDAEAEVA